MLLVVGGSWFMWVFCWMFGGKKEPEDATLNKYSSEAQNGVFNPHRGNRKMYVDLFFWGNLLQETFKF